MGHFIFSAYIAADRTAKTYCGRRARNGAMVIKLVPEKKTIRCSFIQVRMRRNALPKVYIVGAHAEDVDRARRTRTNFPKSPAGERITASN